MPKRLFMGLVCKVQIYERQIVAGQFLQRMIGIFKERNLQQRRSLCAFSSHDGGFPIKVHAYISRVRRVEWASFFFSNFPNLFFLKAVNKLPVLR